jgi:hypothetical protein
MTAALALAGLGLFVLAVSCTVAISQQRNRLQVYRLEGAVDAMTDELRTEEEREAEAERIRRIEDQQRRAHGWHH